MTRQILCATTNQKTSVKALKATVLELEKLCNSRCYEGDEDDPDVENAIAMNSEMTLGKIEALRDSCASFRWVNENEICKELLKQKENSQRHIYSQYLLIPMIEHRLQGKENQKTPLKTLLAKMLDYCSRQSKTGYDIETYEDCGLIWTRDSLAKLAEQLGHKTISQRLKLVDCGPGKHIKAVEVLKTHTLPMCLDELARARRPERVKPKTQPPTKNMKGVSPQIAVDCKIIEWNGHRIKLGKKRHCRIVLAYVFEQAALGKPDFHWDDVRDALKKWRYKAEISEYSRLHHEVFKNCKPEFEHLIETVNLTNEEYRVKIPVPQGWKASGL
jgi:hypothetical protein